MEEAIKKIQDFFNKDQKYILMFSGGIDSSCILGAAIAADIKIKPICVNNGFNRATSVEIIEQAIALGAPNLEMVEVKPGLKVCSNPVDRCFFCKRNILSNIADEDYIIVDGTTKSDLGNYRPGSKALKEFSVKSVLADCGIDKQTASEIALYYGANIKLADMESCLATRFNYNLEITQEKVDIIRNIERFIIEKTDDYNVRCRIDDKDHLRIEVKEKKAYEEFGNYEFRKKIIELAQEITMFVTLDLKPSRPNEYDKRIEK